MACYFEVSNLLKTLTQVNNNKFCLRIDNIGLMLHFVRDSDLGSGYYVK